ncbi:MAG: reverse transcriptase-like protein [Candidatus Nomurabacteria bacterium]|nr:reverse transcriptase-like protein [Candidatus Nomurabacteria bacterium]
MKQRIRVTAICKMDDDILLLRRASGRAEMMASYELPTGRIHFGEQPDEAMARIIYEYLGVQAGSVKLTDAVTFTDLQNASKQGNLFIIYEVELSNRQVSTTNERYNAYKWVKNTETGVVALEEATLMVLRILSSKQQIDHSIPEHASDNIATANAATIYVDGGSRGNPGPSGVGYYIIAADGTFLKSGGSFLGFSTSRLAEYYALKEGVKQALDLGLKKVRFVSDSLMLVSQMNGLYKVKNSDLFQVHTDVVELLGQLDSYNIIHVPREQNAKADAEVNKIIDIHIRKTK